MRTRLLLIMVLLVMRISLQAEDYFPLQAGNRWEYRCTGECGAATMVREITGTERVQPQDRLYYVMREAGAEYRVRSDGGRLLVLDAKTGAEKQWYVFDARVGEDYETSITRCNPAAQISTRSGTFHGARGDVANALRISYTNSCNFAGLDEETFVPGIGMVQRVEHVGTATYDLIRARLSGFSVSMAGGLSLAIALDQAVFAPSEGGGSLEMKVRLRLRNTTDTPVQLMFLTAQRHEFVVRNSAGEPVSQWSAGKMFAAVSGTESVTGELEYTETVPLTDPSGRPLADGQYTVEGWLTTDAKRFSATAAFAIRRTP